MPELSAQAKKRIDMVNARKQRRKNRNSNMKKSPKDQEIKLPEFEVQHVISTLSQVVDWGLKQHNVPDTWKITQGEGETAYVIDTGWSGHRDLGDNCIKGFNAVRGEDIVDRNGHQTHCMGIIAAKNNATGMVGVAPKSKMVAVKALGNDGSGSWQSIKGALQYCLDCANGEYPNMPKPSVVSMSLGAPGDLGKEIHGIIKDLYKLNIPVVVAAGNDSWRGVDYPGRYAETITIAAYDKKGDIADFSAIGSQVDFAAPGVQIYSTYLGNKYAKLNGTSMATPFMAGIVLLLLAKHKKQEAETGKNDCKTVEDIRDHFKKYAIDKGMKGKDDFWGYGIVDTNKLLKASADDTQTVIPDPPKPSDPIKWPKPWWKRVLDIVKDLFK